MSIPKAYEPQKKEDSIYDLWDKSGYFNPDKLPRSAKRKPYTISMPPPNATGTLHVGHAEFLTIEDIFIRYARMKGLAALWVPGTDHASIATQNIVEKDLAKENTTREDLGREKFLAKVNEFVASSQKTIREQIRKIGCSCDWSRERFTLDDGLSKAVRHMFVKMYEDGLIYRGYYMVNWCPRCHSTLADDEVEYKEIEEKLYYIKYGPLTLATVRPETKFGDTAVAVHPKDKKYQKYIGKTIDIETVLGPAKIKVVGDKAVNPEFGTGAIKVTPAHDPTDFAIGERHKLEIKKVIDENGKMNELAGKYAGLTTAKAREQVVADMKTKGLLEKEEPYKHNLSICYRCNTTIEPLTSRQWFVDVNKRIPGKKQSLKETAIDSVKSGKIAIIPDRFNKTYYRWMESLKDWCISRQIWYGHRIPVWYKKLEKPIVITYFVHGATKDNEAGLSTGNSDISLSNLGIKQANELKDKLGNKKFDVVICSDMKRAKETTEIVFGKEYITDKRLNEIDYGRFNQKAIDYIDTEGKKTKELFSLKKEYVSEPFPKGESYLEVKNRIEEFLADVTAKYPGKKIAIVAHSAPQLALDAITNGKSFDQAFSKDWRNTMSWQPGWNYTLDRLTYVGEKAPEDDSFKQDSDTLDTWFSSSLWTFSTLGWPKKTKDLKRFHPTSVMETGYDILFFWVARMIMMTNYALSEIPFKNVYLHGLVRTKSGAKMSKSKPETMIDPLDMISKYGTDALRLSLIIGTTPGNDIRLYEEKIAGYRNFTNKLWNISRFIMARNAKGKTTKPTLADKWIMSRLNQLTKQTTDNLENFKLGQAGDDLYSFVWHELADWYLEISKIKGMTTPKLLSEILDVVLRLLHPFTPFVTETLWQEMGKKKLLMIEDWPKANTRATDKKAEKDFALIQSIITEIRNLRSTYKIDPARKISGSMAKKSKKFILENLPIINQLGRLNLQVANASTKQKQGDVHLHFKGVDILLPLGSIIDVDQEKVRLQKKIDKLKNITVLIGKKLENNEFTANAPEEVVAEEKQRLGDLKDKQKKLREMLRNLE